MATKKTEEKTQKPEEITAAAETEAEEKVTITLPRVKGESDQVYVGHNGKSYLVKRGVPVEVPVGVADVLRWSEEMKFRGGKYDSLKA